LVLLLRPQGCSVARAPTVGQRVMSTYYAGLFADAGILMLGALSVYIILATNQLSLGNAGFMGIGFPEPASQ
jgi:ABC-type branched-subunit amino acid transport system permease subunit